MFVDGENFVSRAKPFLTSVTVGTNMNDKTVLADHFHSEPIVASGRAGRGEKKVWESFKLSNNAAISETAPFSESAVSIFFLASRTFASQSTPCTLLS